MAKIGFFEIAKMFSARCSGQTGLVLDFIGLAILRFYFLTGCIPFTIQLYYHLIRPLVIGELSMELFKDYKPSEGSPLRLEINGTLHLHEVDGVVQVKYGFLPLVKFKRDDWPETYQAAVTLGDDYKISYVIIAKICHLDRNTVSKLVKTKQLLGLRYIFENDKGPKTPWKVVDEIVALIDQAASADAKITNAKIVHLLEQHGHSISESSVRNVRQRHNKSLPQKPASPARKTTLQERNRIADHIARRDLLLYQLQLFQVELPESTTQVDPFDYDQAYENLSAAQKRSLKSWRIGMPCSYAGGLFYFAILQRFGFQKIIQNIFGQYLSDKKEPHCYPLDAIFLTLFFSIVFHFPSIESLKKAKPLEWGVLLGRRRLPGRKVIHKVLNHLSSYHRASKLMKDFAVMFVKERIVDVGILFFDEHFLPYYGIEQIHKGFFSTRRIAHSGNYQHWAHDVNGRPFFVITTDSHLKLRDMMPQMIRRAKAISGRDTLTIVFDRGGYGVALFLAIAAIEKTFFITWAKYVSQKAIAEINEDKYEEFLFEHDGKSESYKLYSTKRTIKEGRTEANKNRPPKKMTVRMIVVWRLSTDKKTPLYTNDMDSPMEKVAYPMTRRWGEQENIFQKMMRRYNLNYHPGYYIDELVTQPMVDNPRRKSLKKEIKELETRITKQKAQLARRMLQLKNKNVSIEAYKNRQRKTLPKLEKLGQQLQGLQRQLCELPEQISIMEVLANQKLSACDLEKKKIYDVIQIIAYNAEQVLVETFRKCYDDKRDIEQILDMIIGYGGYLKVYNNTMYVILNYIDNPKYRKAAVKFCNEINAMTPKSFGDIRIPIFFKIMQSQNPAARC